MSAPLALCALAASVASPLFPAVQEAQAHGTGDVPEQRQAFPEEAREAMARFTIPEGFKVSLFASEPLFAHPVCFTIDALGRFFVAETYRHSRGVTDMRAHMDWLEEDLAAKTVGDRVAMIQRHLSPEQFKDEFLTESERITRLVDTDGDGEADQATVFAAGFEDPAAGIGAGLLAETLPGGGTKMWFTCIPDLWELMDADGDGVAEARSRHTTGYGLRIALLGHDLHGLTMGPYGRMYFTIGDRGFNVETAEGEKLVRFGTGAVFRCERDGSNLEIFCDGLRNPQEIVFDDEGRLFTLDNNSDGGDQARWTYLLEGSDSGWRQAFQWANHPYARGPWNHEKMWHPFHPEQPAHILPCIRNFTSGPSGMTIYPGTGFGPEWKGHFFVCDFRGNPGYSGIYAFQNEADRSGFKLVHEKKFVWDALPTDVEFGPDGNLYWSDWITSYNKTGKGRIYRVAPAERSEEEQALVDEVGKLLVKDLTGASLDELVPLLGHADRRVRERGQASLTEALAAPSDTEKLEVELAFKLAADDPVFLRHAVRAIASASRRKMGLRRFGLSLIGGNFEGVPEATEIELIRASAELLHADAFEGVEPIKLWDEGEVLTARPSSLQENIPFVVDALVERAQSGSAAVAREAVEAIGIIRRGRRDLVDGTLARIVLDALKKRAEDDPWMRHTCIRALERLGAVDQAIEALDGAPEHVRRAICVLLRRAKDPRIASLLEDESPLVRAEAARGIYDVPIAEAMDALAVRLPYLRANDAPITFRRALQANRDLGSPEGAQRIADFAANASAEESLRVEALELLTSWTSPRMRDGIVMDHRPTPAGDSEALTALGVHPVMSVALVEVAVRPAPIADQQLSEREINAQALFGEKKPAPPSAPAVAVASIEFHRAMSRILAPADGSRALQMLAAAEELGGSDRVRAFEALMECYGDERRSQGFAIFARTAPGLVPLRSAAYGMMPDGEAAKALVATARSQDPEERREAVRVLGGLHSPACTEAFMALGAAMGADAPELVEWLAAAEGHPAGGVAAALAARLDAFEASEDPLAGWRMTLEGGDIERGRVIFTTKNETSCTRCHIVGGEGGSEAGPELNGAGLRLSREELLHSIVDPNATIAEGFESWLFSLDDGEVLGGRILEETDEMVVVETPKKEVWELPPSEITARRRDVSAMPADVANHLSRAEMRDLVAYLASLRD